MAKYTGVRIEVYRAPGPLGGRPGTVDHAEVARVACEAHRRGEPITTAVATHFGIKTTAATMRIKTARARGFDIPAGQPTGPRQRPQNDDVPAPVDAPETEPTVVDEPSPAVVETAVPRQPHRSDDEVVSFGCLDCEDTYPTVPELREHVRTVHGRSVTFAERQRLID